MKRTREKKEGKEEEIDQHPPAKLDSTWLACKQAGPHRSIGRSPRPLSLSLTCRRSSQTRSSSICHGRKVEADQVVQEQHGGAQAHGRPGHLRELQHNALRSQGPLPAIAYAHTHTHTYTHTQTHTHNNNNTNHTKRNTSTSKSTSRNTGM